MWITPRVQTRAFTSTRFSCDKWWDELSHGGGELPPLARRHARNEGLERRLAPAVTFAQACEHATV